MQSHRAGEVVAVGTAAGVGHDVVAAAGTDVADAAAEGHTAGPQKGRAGPGEGVSVHDTPLEATKYPNKKMSTNK